MAQFVFGMIIGGLIGFLTAALMNAAGQDGGNSND